MSASPIRPLAAGISHDSQRHEHLLQLLALGYGDQILISQDTCYKTQLVRYGGCGYAHILRTIVPALRHAGVDDTTLERILVGNPKHLLSHWKSPFANPCTVIIFVQIPAIDLDHPLFSRRRTLAVECKDQPSSGATS